MSTSYDTSKKTRFCDFSQRHGNFSPTRVAHLTHGECHKVPRLPRKTTWAHLVTRRKRHVFATFPIGTATSASRRSRTSQTRNVTKCHACHAKRHWTHVVTRRERHVFLNFSHRHGNCSLTTVAHLPHVECHKVPRLPRKTTWAHCVTGRKRHVCATFPIGTATFTLRSVKINAFLRVEPYRPTAKSTFRARHPSIFMTCHKMPRLPRNLHLSPLRTALTMRFAENMQHDTSKVLRLPRKMTSEVFKALCLPRKMRRIVWKRGKNIAPATQHDFWHVVKHVGMSHEVPRLPRKTTWPHLLTIKKVTLLWLFP